jgi:hypothetical protein
MRTTLLKTFTTNPHKIRSICIKARDKAINAGGVLSLSRTFRNILMWSHYAKDRKGLVLGFDALADIEFFQIPINVIYSDTYVELNYFRNREETIARNISTKANLWSYEEEFRIKKSQSKAWPFKKLALTDIYFGCKAEERFMKYVYLACKDNGLTHMRFHKASQRQGEFALDFVMIAPSTLGLKRV